MTEKAKIGLIQVYTGKGKGKTTAALGSAIRAAGHGMKIAFIQFLKGQPSGEHAFLEKYPVFAVLRTGILDCFTASEEQLRLECEQTLDFAEEQMLGGHFDLIVLDEINVAMQKGFISTRRMLHFLDKKPAGTELILTGRGAPPEIIQRADLVTEMCMVKHPYQRRIKARRGIEY